MRRRSVERLTSTAAVVALFGKCTFCVSHIIIIIIFILGDILGRRQTPGNQATRHNQ